MLNQSSNSIQPFNSQQEQNCTETSTISASKNIERQYDCETFVAEGTESSITIYRKCLKDSPREKNNIDDRFCK
ncbi:unnamed protein product, partial [Rotaria sp. Silwood2]